MKWNAWCAAVFALLLLLGGRVGAREAPGRLDLSLVAEIEIGADGRVTSLEWKDRRPAVDFVIERIEPRIRQWRFEPGTIDGVPQVTQTHLTVQVIGEPLGDNALALRFGQARTGARMVKMVPPPFPVSAARMKDYVSLVVLIDIDENGRVRSHSADYVHGEETYRKAFVASIKTMVAKSRFAPERVGGHGVPAQLRIPVDICLESGCAKLERQRELERATGAAAPHAPSGQAVALDSAVRLLTAVEGEAI